jgi:hypothetical protein
LLCKLKALNIHLINLILVVVTSLLPDSAFSQEIGFQLGLLKYTGAPDYSASSNPNSPKITIDETNKIATQISIYLQTQIYREGGIILSTAYSDLNRKFELKNIFLNQDEFRIIPIEMLIYKEFTMKKFYLTPKLGMGYAFGEFKFSINQYVAKYSDEWKYDGSAFGFPAGISFGFRPSNKFDFGIDLLYRHYKIRNFESDYHCNNGKSNEFVFLPGDLPGPSCLDNEGLSNRKAYIDYSNLNISLIFGFVFN